MSAENAKSKVEIIKVSSTNPLAFYSLIIVSLVSLVGALGWVQSPTNRAIIIVGIFFVIVLMIFFVGIDMRSNRNQKTMDLPGHGSALGETAVKGFFDGGDTSKLSGRWEVTWFQQDDSGEVKPYTVKNKQTGEEEPYPNDIVSVKVNGAMVSVEAHDQTTKRIYFLEGRLSVKDTVTLMYWSVPGVAESMLVGVLILRVKRGFKDITMEGDWMGHDRYDRIVSGKVKWEKLTID